LEGVFRKMKILIVLKKWAGGVGIVVQNLKRELEKQKHYIKIISREDDLKVHSLLKSILTLRKKVKELMKKEKYDVIYTQDWSMAFPLFFPYPLFSKKHFCCFHGIEPFILGRLFQNLIGKIMHRNLIVVGDALKAKFPKANLIYNGVNLTVFKPNIKVKKIKNSVGFANWKTDTYNYSVIKKAVKSSGKRFFTAENLSPMEMCKFYNEIEIFISLPPKYTGFNMVWLEAMASGVRKIIGNNAGIGKKLPITKIEKFGWHDSLTEQRKEKIIKMAIENAEIKNYHKWLQKNKTKFSWKNHVSNLIKIFKNEI